MESDRQRNCVRLRVLACFVTSLFLQGGVNGDSTDFFEAKIRPILAEKCERCHSNQSATTHGGLALDTAQGWKNGSDSGEVILPFEPSESLLIRAVEYGDDSLQMPPPDDGGKLSDAEIAALKEWIQLGAVDPRTEETKRGGLTESEIQNWWSFLPVVSKVPQLDESQLSGLSPIDQEISRLLKEHAIEPMPKADRRTLIRRATYDLTGLPPTKFEVEAFENDDSPDAWEKVIARLLSSPRYGERWGRHWLDVVRYADTAGDNTDHPVQDLWRYRNWVIDAFNSNMPYDQFIREQLAGDLIHESHPPDLKEQGIVATGFLALARRFDHDIDTTTHLMLEDAIDVVGKSLLGLTIACARCHDHKYDPITAADYYALYGILRSSRFSFPGCEAKQLPRDLIPLQSDEDWNKLTKPVQEKIQTIEAELAKLTQQNPSLRAPGQEAITLAESEVADGAEVLLAPSSPIKAQVQRGDLLILEVDPQGNYGADTTRVDWTIRSLTHPERSWDLANDLLASRLATNPSIDEASHQFAWLLLDGSDEPRLLTEYVERIAGNEGLTGWRTGDNPSAFMNLRDYTIHAWTPLPAKTFFVHPAPERSVAIGWLSPIQGEIEILGSVADQHPGGPDGVAFKLLHLQSDHSESIERIAKDSIARKEFESELTSQKSRLPARPTAYGVVEGEVADAPIQLRGDPEKPGAIVPRRWIERLGGDLLSRPERSGREELADWITSPSNPLTARVMVNRIWQYHFGKGLVATPNDFGTRGEKPTHPDLLDWLADEFIRSNWNIKKMHRMVMLSEAYQRASSASTPADALQGLERDVKNKLLWRFDRRRLNAEEIRDSLLFLSAKIDHSQGTEHPIPPPDAWGYTQHVPFSSVFPTNRRTVYQLTLRNRRDPYMGLFDGADPNSSTAVRQSSTVPTQSLYFLNDPNFHEHANGTLLNVYSTSRDRLEKRSDVDFRACLVEELARSIWQRKLSLEEIQAMDGFLENYPTAEAQPLIKLTSASDASEISAQSRVSLRAWQALTRVLLSSNEFLYLD